MSSGGATTRTVLDSGVLIAAFRGEDDAFLSTFAILNDPDRVFISSDFVRLELLPKPVFYRRTDETTFYAHFFAATIDWVDCSPTLIQRAYDYGCQFGLNAVDALHIAAASLSTTDEFVTTERVHSPLLRIPTSIVQVRLIHETRS